MGFDLAAWQKNDEYAELCAIQSERAAEILALTELYIPQLAKKRAEASHQTTRYEFSTESHMTRGYYCPSLAIDYYVGNTTRGQLLEKITKKRQNYWEYAFDASDRMLWAKHYLSRRLFIEEYLFYEENRIIGFAEEVANGFLYCVVEDYEGDRLVRYTSASLFRTEGKYQCPEIHTEEYEYDEDGLFSCVWSDFFPERHFPYFHPATFLQSKIHLEREDGYLKRYWVGDLLGESEIARPDIVYEIVPPRVIPK